MTKTLNKACLCAAVSGTAFIAAMAISGDAQASGFQLREVSGSLQGSSFAGMSTQTDDASQMFFNPGSVGQFKESTYSVGSSLVMPNVKLKRGSFTAGGLTTAAGSVSNATYGDMGQDALVPNAHAVWKLSNNVNFGISLTTPWGLVTDYESDFAGRFFGTTSSIKTANVKPVLAYRFDNGLAIGGGAQIQYMDARLAKAVGYGAGEGNGDVTGDDLAAGWTAGLNWELPTGTRIGASYVSEITHNLKGDIKFDSAAKAGGYRDQSAEADVTTPEYITLGVAQDIGEKWTVMADGQWTNWKSIDTLTFNYGGDTNVAAFAPGVEDSSSEVYNWSSSWFVSLGAKYRYDENWTFRGGVAYDQTPISDEYRSVRIPDSNRYWLSLGASYKVADWADVSLGYTHIFAHNATVDHSEDNIGSFQGQYESKVDIIALQAKFQF
ncbi:OmpP1/FadL family transporter [Thalassospira sp. MCCC 1A01428]|uniref:OmpP1/FadL family transporter n=1 Tax=Thalassospira sp. MCCC 1A01428 TaxID=1470575 RepID=UPI000A1ECBAF|nr:outer membrane protein transport protein [Thalassospira sp. MCCC 1A01428]OSQ43964.1 long-chain fatty acid transporter [Thalassospira sp. MCCC 1A01428]